MSESVISKSMIIVESDKDLSKSLALFFSPDFDVSVVTEFDRFNDSYTQAKILLIDADFFNAEGLNTLKKIRSFSSELLIVVMGTARSKDDPNEKIVRNLVDAVVYKPFDVGNISRIINRLQKTNSAANPSA